MDVRTAMLLVVALLVLGSAAWFYLERRRTSALRAHYGAEYDRLVRSGSRRHAEAELVARGRRVESLDIRPLRPDERERYAGLWRKQQARFVDDPGGAVLEADALVGEVMRARGYAVGSFERQAADVSVDHPWVVQYYREAHDTAERHRQGAATTDDLRGALIHYRALFEDLLGETPAAAEVRKR